MIISISGDKLVISEGGFKENFRRCSIRGRAIRTPVKVKSLPITLKGTYATIECGKTFKVNIAQISENELKVGKLFVRAELPYKDVSGNKTAEDSGFILLPADIKETLCATRGLASSGEEAPEVARRNPTRTPMSERTSGSGAVRDERTGPEEGHLDADENGGILGGFYGLFKWLFTPVSLVLSCLLNLFGL